MYQRVGFRTFDTEVEEIAGGRKDRFRKMQIFAKLQRRRMPRPRLACASSLSRAPSTRPARSAAGYGDVKTPPSRSQSSGDGRHAAPSHAL